MDYYRRHYTSKASTYTTVFVTLVDISIIPEIIRGLYIYLKFTTLCDSVYGVKIILAKIYKLVLMDMVLLKSSLVS